MKSVLMVVYSLPFHKSGRVASLLNNLRSYGWQPVLLTHGTGFYDQEDQVLQIPEDIDVIHTNHRITAGLPRVIHAAAGFFSTLLFDGQKLWQLLSSRKASRIIKNGGVDLVYTVSPPFYAHHLGLSLKKKFPNLPWVADLGSVRTPLRHHDKSLLTRVKDSADYVVEAESDIQALELSELFEKACRAIVAKKLENV